jgi:UDP:flavonoid glycosyltransferase YjiC (YdhE family)
VIRKSAPHGEVMRQAAAVVTHAGHGTVMRALVHKVPLLCMPMGRDQHDNTARVVARGAGLELRPSAPPSQIANAVFRLLDEPSFRLSARRLGEAVSFEAANSSIVDELESLAHSPTGSVNCSAAA